MYRVTLERYILSCVLLYYLALVGIRSDPSLEVYSMLEDRHNTAHLRIKKERKKF